MYKESRINWLANLSRPKLDKYINQTRKLLEEAYKENDKHNIGIYSLWLADAVFESNKRQHNKELYLSKLKKGTQI